MTSPRLGDLTQIPVTVNPTQALPALGDVQVTLYNQDITNLVWVSYTQWFKAGSGVSIPIQPLTSITISAKRAIYVASTVAGVASLLLLPEGSQANPSPAQIAAQINTLGLATSANQVTGTNAINALPAGIAGSGVPLLALSTQVANDTAGHAIAAGASLTLGPYTGWTQHSYEIYLAFTDGAGTNGLMTVTLVWTNSVGAVITKTDAFNCPVSNLGTLWTVGFGPIGAQSLQVIITNNDTVSCTLNTIFIAQTSKTFTTDAWQNAWNGTAMPAVPGFTVGNAFRSPANRLLLAKSGSLAASASSSNFLAPLWSGSNLHLQFQGGGGSNNWTCQVTNAFTGNQLFKLILSSGNFGDKIFIPSRSPYLVQATNTGSVTGTYAFELTAV